MDKIECKSCGCHLNHADVRQLALYYRQEHPSMVAVQYVCPRCGATEWQQYDPADWQGENNELTPDWAALVRELGVKVSREESRPAGADADVEPEPDAPLYDLSRSISVDEYIDFGYRVDHLSSDDLHELMDASAG